jgi:uncharacterized coiled-coil DUF342 family protein
MNMDIHRTMTQGFIADLNEVNAKVRVLNQKIQAVVETLPEYHEKLKILKEVDRIESLLGLKGCSPR